MFYADDELVTGTDSTRTQASMDIITQGFASLGLKMNASKTEYMVMTGGRHKVKISTTAYNRSVTGIGPTYDQRRKMKVHCLKCGDTVLGRPSLKRHQLSAKCREASLTFQPPTPVRERVAAEQAITPVGVSSLYSTSIPTNPIDSMECPVHGCEYRVSARNDKSKRFSTRKHFRIRHIEDTIVIDQEGQLPQCRLCEFFGTRICASCNPLSSCT